METLLIVGACFVFALVGAIIGSIANARLSDEVVKPLIE